MTPCELNINSIRWTLGVACALIFIFMIADLSLLPQALHFDYMLNRIAIQMTAIVFFIAFSFHDKFPQYRHLAFFICLNVITLANFHLIEQCWLKMQYSFPYEDTIIYALFAFLVFRIQFNYGLIYVVVTLSTFIYLLINYPIYGSLNLTNFSFVLVAHIICLIGAYTVASTVDNEQKLTEKLMSLSRIDPVSGLYNRRAYEYDARIHIQQAQMKNIPVSVFLIDLDDFKAYNQAFGHQKGDEIILEQGNMLKDIFKRQLDIVGRYGGEEFIVIASDMSADVAQKMADKILTLWRDKKLPQAHNNHLTCSIGTATIMPGEAQMDLQQLINAANHALMQAKQKGKNTFESAKFPA